MLCGSETQDEPNTKNLEEEVSLMSLIRWNPTFPSLRREFPSLREFDRLFDGLVSQRLGDAAATFSPAVGVDESAEDFTVRVDLPGVSQRDVKVSLMGDTLTIRGERKQGEIQKDRNAHRIERTHGAFERIFTFGTPVKNEGIHARYR